MPIQRAHMLMTRMLSKFARRISRVRQGAVKYTGRRQATRERPPVRKVSCAGTLQRHLDLRSQNIQCPGAPLESDVDNGACARQALKVNWCHCRVIMHKAFEWRIIVTRNVDAQQQLGHIGAFGIHRGIVDL